MNVDSSPKVPAFALALFLLFAILASFTMSVIAKNNPETGTSFGGDLESIAEGAYVNYTLQNGDWFFWEVVAIFPNQTTLVAQINQTSSGRFISFLTVPVENPAVSHFYLWTQTKMLRPGDSGLLIANGSADVVSDVIITIEENKTTIPLRAYRLVVTNGPFKGYVLHYEAVTGILLEYYLSSEEVLPFMQISDTNLHLSLPEQKSEGISPLEMMELALSFSLFFGSILILYALTHYKIPKKRAEAKDSD